MLFPIFMIGSFWFWSLLVAAFLILILCVEFEAPFKAFGTLVLTGSLLVLFGNFNPLNWIAAHPLETMGVTVGYFVVGAVWSIIKWWLFIGRRKEKYEDLKSKWMTKRDIQPASNNQMPDELSN